MKTIITIVAALMLSGCFETIKIKPYPEPPHELMQPAEKLKALPEQATLPILSSTITHNYTSYHIVAERLRLLQDWVTKTRKESLNVDGGTKGSQETLR